MKIASGQMLQWLNLNTFILLISLWSIPAVAEDLDISDQAAGHVCKLYNRQNQLVGFADAKYGKIGVPAQNGGIAVAGVIFSQQFSDDLLITITGLAQGVPTLREAGKVNLAGEVFKYNWHSGYPSVGRIDVISKSIIDAKGRFVGKFDGCETMSQDLLLGSIIGGAAEVLGFFGSHVLASRFTVCPAGACHW